MRKLNYLFILTFIGFLTACSTESTPVYQLNTETNPEDVGSVSPSEGEYDEGTTVEITANANEHWVFVGWQGDHSGTQNPDSITVNSDMMVRAMFEKRDYPLTVEQEGSGAVEEEIVSPKSTEYPHGTSIQLTAIPDTGWEFSEWTGDLNSTENPSVIDIAGETFVTVHFDRQEFLFTTQVEGQGSISKTLIEGTETEDGYLFESVLEVEAEPETGWDFIRWEGSLDSSENPSQIIFDDDKSLTAIFEEIQLYLALSSDGSGNIQVDPDKDSYSYNEEVTLTAVPDDGWEFAEWSGDLESSQNPATITMDTDKEITATFEKTHLNLIYSADGSGTIQVDPERDSYTFNEEVTLTAVPDDGWEFTEWSGDIETSQNPVTITMDTDKEITAHFNELCNDPEECVSTQFYASSIVGPYVFDSNLSIENNLPEPIYLTRIRIRRGDGSFAAESENINEWIEPDNSLSFSADYLPQPTTDEFQEFTAEFFYEYQGSSYSITNQGTVSSFKEKQNSVEYSQESEPSETGIRLIK